MKKLINFPILWHPALEECQRAIDGSPKTFGSFRKSMPVVGSGPRVVHSTEWVLNGGAHAPEVGVKSVREWTNWMIIAQWWLVNNFVRYCETDFSRLTAESELNSSIYEVLNDHKFNLIIKTAIWNCAVFKHSIRLKNNTRFHDETPTRNHA